MYMYMSAYTDVDIDLDVDMDCSQTEGGWFEVKAFLTNDGKSFVRKNLIESLIKLKN